MQRSRALPAPRVHHQRDDYRCIPAQMLPRQPAAHARPRIGGPASRDDPERTAGSRPAGGAGRPPDAVIRHAPVKDIAMPSAAEPKTEHSVRPGGRQNAALSREACSGGRRLAASARGLPAQIQSSIYRALSKSRRLRGAGFVSSVLPLSRPRPVLPPVRRWLLPGGDCFFPSLLSVSHLSAFYPRRTRPLRLSQPTRWLRNCQ
jgi:hypothetical protein